MVEEAQPAHEALAPGPSDGPSPAPAGPRPPRWGLGAFLLVALVYVAVSVLLVFGLAGRHSLSAGILALVVVAPTAAAAGLAVLITTLRGNGPRTDLRLGWSWRGFWMGLAFGFGGLLVTIPASLMYRAVVGPGANSAVGKVFGGLHSTWPGAVAVLLVVTLAGPLCEEIIFRGLLWGAVERRWGRWAALMVSVVVFALAHVEFTRTPVLVVAAIPIALARWYSGGLLASIIAHQVTNLLPGIVLMLAVLGLIPAS